MVPTAIPGCSTLAPAPARGALACAALALCLGCGGKQIRYDAGAFSIQLPKGIVIEHAPGAQVSDYFVRLGHDGPVCASVRLTHEAGGACGTEQLRLQKGDEAHCDEQGEACFACVELDGSAAQLHAKGTDDAECGEVARGFLKTLRVKPALHR